jgi:chaperonin GroES
LPVVPIRPIKTWNHDAPEMTIPGGNGPNMLHSIGDRHRQLIVVGDRVLVKPEQPDARTEVGLYLPETVLDKEKIQAGRIVAVGPGVAIPEMTSALEDEPWKESSPRPRYIPMQAEEGDYALFLKKSAIEIKFEGETYLVVPQAGILLLLRDLH